MRISAFLAMLVLMPLNVLAQTPRTKIYLSCQCDDTVGQLFATAFRDAVAQSLRYEMTSSLIEGKVEEARFNWALSVVSLDPSVGKVGKSTVMSLVVIEGFEYFTQSVQICDAVKVKDCADYALSFIDDVIAKHSE